MANDTTGGVGGWIRMFKQGTGETYMFVQEFDSTTNNILFLRVYADGSLDGGIDAGANEHIVTTVSSGLIVDGQWHTVWLQQPGDGTGCQIWVDGVKQSVTISNAGTGTNDDWLDDMYADFTGPTEVRMFVGFGAGAEIYMGTVGAWGALEGSILSDSQALGMYNAANLGGDTEDMREWIIDNIDPLWYIGQTYENAARASTSIGREPHRLNGAIVTDATGPFTDTEINHYHNGAALMATGGPTSFSADDYRDGPLTDTVGTWAFWGKTESVLTSQATAIGWGNSAADQIKLGVDSSGDFHYTMISNTANTYKLAITSGLTLAASTWYFFCVTQDGIASKIYVDGVQYSGGNVTESTAGAGIDATSWHNNFNVKTSAAGSQYGARQGSTISENWNSDLGDLIYNESALTSTEVLDMHNATQGTFA